MATVGNQHDTYTGLARGEEALDFVVGQGLAVGLQIVGAKGLVEPVGFVAIGIRLVGAVAGP